MDGEGGWRSKRLVCMQQAPAGAGGTGGAGGPLDFLRSNPQFIALRQIVQSNPMILQPMLQVNRQRAFVIAQRSSSATHFQY